MPLTLDPSGAARFARLTQPGSAGRLRLLGAARERIRVAHALPELPLISRSFSEGRISYSKVRAMTRVATPKNEEFLLQIARHGTAAHVEKVVSNYRYTQRLEALEKENVRHAQRELSWIVDHDGMWLFKGKFTPEQGALIQKALEGAMDELFEEQRNEPDEVSAETPQGVDPIDPRPHPVAAHRADALERIADVYLSGETGDPDVALAGRADGPRPGQPGDAEPGVRPYSIYSFIVKEHVRNS